MPPEAMPPPPEDKSSDIGRLQANVKNTTIKINEVSEGLKILQAKVAKNNTTNWSVIASLSGVTLSIITILGYLAMDPMREEIRRLRAFKNGAIRELTDLGESLAVQKERTRALERSEFDEPKDQ